MFVFGPRTGGETGGTTNTISAYVFDDARLNERWSINGGVRVDVYKLNTDNVTAAGVRTALELLRDEA